MSKRLYYCCVAGCATTSRDPNKLFFTAPVDADRRTLWFKAINRNQKEFSEKTSVQVCEDHFDLERDLENYVRFKYYPQTRRKILRKDAVPHIFKCHSEMIVVKEEYKEETEEESGQMLGEKEIQEEVDTFENCQKLAESFEINIQESVCPSVRSELPHMDRMYLCTQCSYQANWPFELDHHIIRVHNYVYKTDDILELEQFSCTCCSFTSSYKLCLYEHLKYEHHVRNDRSENEKPGLSEQQKSVFNNYRPYSRLSFLKHKMHNVLSEVPSSGRNEKEILAVEQAKVSHSFIAEDFESSSCTIEDGTSECNSFRLIKCEQSSSKAKYEQNMRSPAATKNNFKNELRRCAECSFITEYSQSLKRHSMLIHGLPKDIMAQGNTADLFHVTDTPHVNTADNDMSFLKCSQCSFQSKHRGIFEAHMLEHDSEWYECTRCSFKTKFLDSLNTHTLQHDDSEDIPLTQCPKCSYRSKQKTNMKRHMKIHEIAKDGWFRCEDCSYKSKYKVNWKRHLVKHVPIQKTDSFSCPECPFYTKYKHCLKIHMLNVHASVKEKDWLTCAKCSYRTKRKRNLLSHERKHNTILIEKVPIGV